MPERYLEGKRDEYGSLIAVVQMTYFSVALCTPHCVARIRYFLRASLHLEVIALENIVSFLPMPVPLHSSERNVEMDLLKGNKWVFDPFATRAQYAEANTKRVKSAPASKRFDTLTDILAFNSNCDLSSPVPSPKSTDLNRIKPKSASSVEQIVLISHEQYSHYDFIRTINLIDIHEDRKKYVKNCISLIGLIHEIKELIDIAREEPKRPFQNACSDTDQISCCVDDLLERLIFRFYEDVLKSHFYSMSKGEEHCLEQAKENDEILREAVALHAKFEIPLPEWLEPQAQSVTDICDICDDKYLLNELDPVFRKLDQMPFVFDIVPEAKHIAVKVLKAKTEKETTQQVDAVKRECKIKADLFKIKMITFNKCTKYKYESGNELTVENRTGTLSGFAKMKQLETEKMVAILAGHVADDKKSKHFDTTLKIQKETVGEIRPRATNLEGFSDISIADISKEISQHCDKKFKNEDNERFIAVPLQTDSGEQKKSRFERVHIWGAKSKPGTAQVKEYGIPRPDATGLIYIAKEPHASIETYWKEGDSGAMVLSERYRREKDQHLIAIGLFIGQSIEDDGTKYVVFSLQSGFDHLSKDYDARFKLYKDESNEEEDD
ncbi:hypothetical protein MAR_002130 [Mya arenaria]|uniref:Uncharacterized protein n=1 Tax=Mya arenaria TaxID=6604 RepID=A0ABY7FGY5_MYAAR|nr:hypothetical protein MAR_002130 [Mya arenaria]